MNPIRGCRSELGGIPSGSLPSTDGSHSDFVRFVQSNGKFGMIDASNLSEYGPYAASGGNGKHRGGIYEKARR